MPKNNLNEFNNPQTLAIISPYLVKGENFCGYSIGRYTKLLAESFPKNQKVVVFCDTQGGTRPHKISKNILLIPSYKINSSVFLVSLLTQIAKFSYVKNFLIQFEFSIFGGKKVVLQIPILLAILKIFGKKINITLHQVLDDIGALSGHLALKEKSLKTSILNTGLKGFYTLTGLLSDKIIVHDHVLAERIVRFVKKDKIKVISHGTFSLSKFSKKFESSSRKYFSLKRGYKLVGAFGFCSWYKGTDWLIENFARFARSNPKIKVRLIVAGGESPTLKGTKAYKIYHEKLIKVIKEANGNIIYTGFVPEADVEKVFAACDLMAFPYRARMSASGALSLCLGYGKPLIVSKAFAESDLSFKNNLFDLNYKSFERILDKGLADGGEFEPDFVNRSWVNAGEDYLREILPDTNIESKLDYAEAI